MRKMVLGLLTSLLLIVPLPSKAEELELIPLAPNHPGFTVRASPVLCSILIGKAAADRTVKFTLMDSRKNRPDLEVQLPSSFLSTGRDSLRCVDLKDYNIKLEPEIEYRWFISIVRNPESRAQDIVAGGAIERCDFSDCIFPDLETCTKVMVVELARAGIWYDSVSCLCQLIKANPDDQGLSRMLGNLLSMGGVQGIYQRSFLVPL